MQIDKSHGGSREERGSSALLGDGRVTPPHAGGKAGQSLLEALAGCGSFIYSLLLFILRLVFAKAASAAHAHQAPPGLQGVQEVGEVDVSLDPLSPPLTPHPTFSSASAPGEAGSRNLPLNTR